MQNRIITMCCSICMLIPLVGNASAITVPPDVKDVADSAAELAKGVEITGSALSRKRTKPL